MEGFEPSTPYGDLFLRQARIPFRHAGQSNMLYDNASKAESQYDFCLCFGNSTTPSHIPQSNGTSDSAAPVDH